MGGSPPFNGKVTYTWDTSYPSFYPVFFTEKATFAPPFYPVITRFTY